DRYGSGGPQTAHCHGRGESRPARLGRSESAPPSARTGSKAPLRLPDFERTAHLRRRVQLARRDRGVLPALPDQWFSSGLGVRRHTDSPEAPAEKRAFLSIPLARSSPLS